MFEFVLPSESTLPVALSPEYNVSAKESLPTGALTVTVQVRAVAPPFVVQLGELAVRLTTTGVPALTAIEADSVAAETYSARRAEAVLLELLDALGILMEMTTLWGPTGTGPTGPDGSAELLDPPPPHADRAAHSARPSVRCRSI
jgi:hypothetical protein